MSRVAVLGAAGYIGKELCRRLSAMGAELSCFDRAMPAEDRTAAGPQAHWVLGDFSDPEAVARAVEGCDYVFHLISTTIPDTSDKDLPADLRGNVLATLGLLEAVKGAGLKKFVFISSGGTVYGVPREIPISELHPTDPICGYGIHKLAIEKYLHWYRHHHGLDYCILRLSNPYGPSQVSDRPQGAIGRFVYKALVREPIEIWGDGSTVRDYIHIDDAIEAFTLAMRYSGDKRVFNVGSGVGHSLLDIASAIEKLTGRVLDIRFSPARSTDLPLNILDISRISSEFDWHPALDLEAGIGRMLESGRRKGLGA